MPLWQKVRAKTPKMTRYYILFFHQWLADTIKTAFHNSLYVTLSLLDRLQIKIHTKCSSVFLLARAMLPIVRAMALYSKVNCSSHLTSGPRRTCRWCWASRLAQWQFTSSLGSIRLLQIWLIRIFGQREAESSSMQSFTYSMCKLLHWWSWLCIVCRGTLPSTVLTTDYDVERVAEHIVSYIEYVWTVVLQGSQAAHKYSLSFLMSLHLPNWTSHNG